MTPRTYVYVDGFNLYYGCLKGTPHRWLDIGALCSKVFPNNDIVRIRYFTALVKSPPNDPQKQQRQLTYLRALATTPRLSVHRGTFQTHVVQRELARPGPSGQRFVEVLDPKEKGSDVNIASYLLSDGYLGDFDVAVLITNDSDLCLPISIVKEDLSKPVIVLSPTVLGNRRPSNELRKVATSMIALREASLRGSQFSVSLSDVNGVISKPPSW